MRERNYNNGFLGANTGRTRIILVVVPYSVDKESSKHVTEQICPEVGQGETQIHILFLVEQMPQPLTKSIQKELSLFRW